MRTSIGGLIAACSSVALSLVLGAPASHASVAACTAPCAFACDAGDQVGVYVQGSPGARALVSCGSVTFDCADEAAGFCLYFEPAAAGGSGTCTLVNGAAAVCWAVSASESAVDSVVCPVLGDLAVGTEEICGADG